MDDKSPPDDDMMAQLKAQAEQQLAELKQQEQQKMNDTLKQLHADIGDGEAISPLADMQMDEGLLKPVAGMNKIRQIQENQLGRVLARIKATLERKHESWREEEDDE